MNAASPEAGGPPGHPPSRKFRADGTACRFPGNAVLCRIGSGNPGFGTVDSIQSALRHETFSAKFAFVPSASLHMVVFDGAKSELREEGWWPQHMPDKPLAGVSEHFRQKLAAMDAPAAFHMKPTGVTLDPASGSVIRLAPGDHAEVRRLRLLRERLADLLDIRVSAAADYGFQIVLSYLVGALDPAEHAAVDKVHAALTVHLSRALSMLELARPEFCTHENLVYYERSVFLGEAGR